MGLSDFVGRCHFKRAYVLWYAILKHIDRVTASTVQLSVPCLAIIGGSLFVNETVTGRVILSSFMVLFGILLVIYVRPQKLKMHK